ncbi:MAG: ABC transporter ATP-binding protein [Candidatus Aerophobetes bacterium]|nr:ABC transporter ATP-binding protein [Candidatus Aerophobetes bacterium]
MRPLLEIKNLHVRFRTFKGELKVLNGVNMVIGEGERVGLVGETGCGKTTTMKSVLRVLPPPARISAGEIFYRGKDILRMKPGEIQNFRREISAIFQDPLTALNPVFTVGHQLHDVIKYLSKARNGKYLSREEIKARCIAVLEETGMPDSERILSNYPVQLSGGMRQRVCISEALSVAAQLLIADEPTTSLDVTIQDQILRLLARLVEEKNISIILITHAFGVVSEVTDRVYVMYAGNIVETARTEEFFSNPLHPYTHGLMNAIPKLTGEGIAKGIEGRIPNYLNPPAGCRFHPRCKHKTSICKKKKPPLFTTGDNHRVACFLYQR